MLHNSNNSSKIHLYYIYIIQCYIIVIIVVKLIYIRASKKQNACIIPAKAAHSHTHTFMSHKTIKKEAKQQ